MNFSLVSIEVRSWKDLQLGVALVVSVNDGLYGLYLGIGPVILFLGYNSRP